MLDFLFNKVLLDSRPDYKMILYIQECSGLFYQMEKHKQFLQSLYLINSNRVSVAFQSHDKLFCFFFYNQKCAKLSLLFDKEKGNN